MYAEFFKLTGLPFQLTPDSRFFFESSVHSKAMAHLTYGLNQGEGFIVITGDVGAGKTTLVEHLCSSLDPQRYTIARISTTQTSADDTLRMVAAGFGIKTEDVEKANLLQRLEATLVNNYRAGRRSLLVVDEAQNLTVPALEELRMLSNFVVGNLPPLQSFLLGQPQFRPIMALPELEQLRQRVLASYHLGPLSEAETRAYVEHRLKRVGWQDDPRFADDVFAALYEATGGVPRKINTLCSRLLLFAFLEEAHDIDGEMAIQVADELKSELSGGPGAPARPAPAPLPGGQDISHRLTRIEERIDKHDHAIKRALAIAASYIQGNVA
jgi:putative secretion ATPase (PEP-CTERM system associated)